MKPMWVVQTNMLAKGQVDPVTTACKKHGIDYLGIEVIPFDDQPLNLPAHACMIPYGSTRMSALPETRAMFGFIDDSNFLNDVWFKNRNDMLNGDGKIMPIGEAIEYVKTLEFDTFFMRPDEDLKLFTGCIATRDTLMSTLNSLIFDAQVPLDKKIMISAPKNIKGEWRYFVVDGKVIDGSMYKWNNRFYTEAAGPAEIAEAQAMADRWHPADVYVMDLCLTSEGLKVVEYNGFNSTGFYANNVEKIVVEVTTYMDRKFNKR